MMTWNRRGWIAAVCISAAWLAVVPYAQADKKWKKITEIAAGGDAKEIAVDREATAIRLVCIEGTVGITTVWVREGEAKTPHKVTAEIAKGQAHEIDLGGTKHVTGLRISDSGSGKYRILAR